VHSYKYGSLSHTRRGDARAGVEHNIECIEIGKALGSKALTVWVGDGSNFPGQSNFTRVLRALSRSMREIYAALPDDWKLFIRAQDVRAGLLFDRRRRTGAPAYLIAQTLGPKATASSTSATMRRTPTSR
jgi:L-rhamnose isomerase/sugar isomerase